MHDMKSGTYSSGGYRLTEGYQNISLAYSCSPGIRVQGLIRAWRPDSRPRVADDPGSTGCRLSRIGLPCFRCGCPWKTSPGVSRKAGGVLPARGVHAWSPIPGAGQPPRLRGLSPPQWRGLREIQWTRYPGGRFIPCLWDL